jgi:hypothetical protein
MTARTVTVTVEWALRGKTDRNGEDILGSSTGNLNRKNFEEAIGRFTLGAPEQRQLPQISVSYVHADGPISNYLALAIHDYEAAPGPTGFGRLTQVTRYFCVPYRQLAEGAITYQAMYEAFSPIKLPPRNGRVLTCDIVARPPRLARPGDLALPVAALLLTGRPVCVLGAEAVGVADRLAFIDLVMSLLPYGLRTKMAAATWTRPTNRDHKFRLFFSDAARTKSPPDHVVSWGATERPAALPEGDHAPRYLAWLTETVSQPMALLAGITEPTGFSSTSVSRVLELARVPGQEPGPFGQASADDPTGPLPRVSTDPTEAVLLRCVAELSAQNPDGLRDCISALRTICAAQPITARPGSRTRYQQIATQYRLLRPGLRLYGHENEFYDMLLELAFGLPLDYQGYCQVEACIAGTGQSGKPGPIAHHPLMRSVQRAARSGVREGAADVRVLAIAAHSLGEAELSRWFRAVSIDAGQLIRVLAEKWGRPDHARIVEDVALRFLRDQPTRYSRRALLTALQAHGYLAPALQLRYPESTERQTNLLEGLLAAAYPKGLDAAAGRAIRAASPESTTLFAVVLGMTSNTLDRMAIVDEFTRNQLTPPDSSRP